MRHTVRRLLLLTCALLPFLSGCVSLPEASPEMQRRALSFTPPAGKANVYLIRPGVAMGAAVLWGADLDSQEFGMLAIKTYLHGYVSPGDHSLRTASGKRAVFTAEAGHNYFFLVVPHLTQIETQPLPEAEGRRYVQEYRLSGDTRFDLNEQARGSRTTR